LSGWSERRFGIVAAVVLASVQAVATVGFGIWATATKMPGLAGRLAVLAGVNCLVLVVVLASVKMAAWARRIPAGRRPPSAGQAQAVLAAAGVPGPGAAAGQVVVGDIPREPPGFRPRADLLAELGRAGGPAPVVQVVTGAPGVGKTQLAAAWARARLAAGWRLVAWVNAADPGALLAGLAAVADALGLAGGRTGQDAGDAGQGAGHANQETGDADQEACDADQEACDADQEACDADQEACDADQEACDAGQEAGDAGQAVRRRLEADGERCLVVFDSAPDLARIRPLLPARGSARVLVTSGRPPPAGPGGCVPVDAFSPDEALAFLAGRTGLTDTAGAGALARELGYLPLALAQAAAVIAAQRLAYGTYLEQLRSLPVNAYVIREARQAYPPGVAEAVLLSLDMARAGDRTGVCSRVLEITAVLSAAGVGRGLLRDAGQAGVLAAGRRRAEVPAGLVDRALEQLAEWSLLTISLDGETVVVHCLVKRVVQDVLARRARFTAVCRDAAAVLHKRAQALVRSPDPRAVRDIAGQVMALQESMTGPACETDTQLARTMLRLRSWALYYLTVLGDSAPQAILVGQPVTADLALMLGADHCDTLASRNNLAIAYLAVGRAAEAVRLHEQTLAGRERVLGADHPDTWASRNNLAVAYLRAGRAAEAIPLLEQSLAARERVLGADHPDTRAARDNLAIAHQAGRAAGREPEVV
jgi:tetratricopeptide (TPR) repeat protein